MLFRSRPKTQGFAVAEAFIGLAVLALIAFVGVKLALHKQPQTVQSSSDQATGAQTNCSSRPTLQTPVDLSKVSGILYPGQYRGNEYKAHGAFRFDGSKPTEITIKAPLDASLDRASRYTQSGDVQILLEFTAACGISYRFDHILTVAPKLQAVIDTLPQPTADSHTEPVEPPVKIKAGEVVAVAIGSPSTGNIFVDFGVYDTRHQNQASQDPAWLAKHQTNPNDQYGVCWFDWLSTADAAKVRSLPVASQESGATSDYCHS